MKKKKTPIHPKQGIKKKTYIQKPSAKTCPNKLKQIVKTTGRKKQLA